MDFINIAKSRSSVRDYNNKKVEPEKLEKILEAAHVAPTAANLQPVHLIVVQSEEGLAKIGKAANIYGASLAIIVCADHDKACLVYMGGLSGVSTNDLKQRITYYLEKTSLTEHQNKKMRQLSGGMKRRVGLIQALLNNPDFLIIDEPTTGLDPEERIRIRNLLVDFSKDRTVLFSTHVVEDLAATCTQLSIMKKGSFLYSGSVSGLLENAKGCVWNSTVQNAEEARLLEANYSISSKQYVENGIHMKVLSKGKPNEKCVPDNDITLEDAYIYLTNS